MCDKKLLKLKSNCYKEGTSRDMGEKLSDTNCKHTIVYTPIVYTSRDMGDYNWIHTQLYTQLNKQQEIYGWLQLNTHNCTQSWIHNT